eukprot:11207719-Lingulodinium_polyedra.AAC.1
MSFPALANTYFKDWYLQVPEDKLADLWRGAGRCGDAAFAEAARVHRDYDLSAWGSARNENKGLAPTPQMVLRQLR